MIQYKNKKIITLCGLPATGKGTLAKAIQNVYGENNVGIYNTDSERKNFNYDPTDRNITQHMYDIVLHRMLEFLPTKNIHILDVTFFKKELREKVLKMSKECGIEKHLITLDVPHEILRQRVEERKIRNEKDSSNIYGGVSNVKVLDFLIEKFEWPDKEELKQWNTHNKIIFGNNDEYNLIDAQPNFLDFHQIFSEVKNIIK